MRLIQSISGSGWLALLVAWSIMSHYGSAYAQTAPTPAVRKELLKVRQRIWESYFRNDQTQLQQSIGAIFSLSIQTRSIGRIEMNSSRELKLLRVTTESLYGLLFPEPRFKTSVT